MDLEEVTARDVPMQVLELVVLDGDVGEKVVKLGFHCILLCLSLLGTVLNCC